MSDYILIDGDDVIFNPVFGVAAVVVKPGVINGSGKGTVKGKPLCIKGDEASVSVDNCDYIAGLFTIPGKGTLKINALGSGQIAQKTRNLGQSVLLKGTLFTAVFEVKIPAQQPGPPPVNDPTPQYAGGTGQFKTNNTLWKGL